MSMYEMPTSRTLVAPGRGLGGMPLTAAWWRRVLGSALAAGARRWRVRPSERAFSGAVVVVGFASQAAARRFAGAWGWWCGCRLAMRRRVSGGRTLWAVSVPVNWPGGRGSGQGGRGGHVVWVPRD